MNKNYELKEFFNHKQILSFLTKRDSKNCKYQQYDEQICEVSYEYEHDNKESKFLSKEKSHSLYLSIPTMFKNWSMKFESTE